MAAAVAATMSRLLGGLALSFKDTRQSWGLIDKTETSLVRPQNAADGMQQHTLNRQCRGGAGGGSEEFKATN